MVCHSMLRYTCGCPYADTHNISSTEEEEEAKQAAEQHPIADSSGDADINASGMVVTPVLLQMVLSAASLAVAHEPAGPPAAMLHQLQSKLTTPICILSASNNRQCALGEWV